MPLVTDRSEVLEILAIAREKGTSIPCFCTENRATTECIARSAHEIGIELGVKLPPVIIGFTVGYHARSNTDNIWDCRNRQLGVNAILNDIKLITSHASPYQNLRALITLDHGQPDADADLLENHLDQFSIVMYDCSKFPLEDNIKLTAAYVERHKKDVVIEGAVDELKEASSDAEFDITTVEQARRFIAGTGCDLIVANLGTEHRAASAGRAKYHPERAIEIRDAVGKIIVLHGTSSLGDNDLKSLPSDGVIKVNIWTILERKGGQAVARHIIKDLGNILDEDAVRELVAERFLGGQYLTESYAKQVCDNTLGPKLNSVTSTCRRIVWSDEVVATMKRYYRMFGYDRLASS